MYCTKPLLAFFLTLISTCAWSQFLLKGRVVSDSGAAPLAAASVFLSNTSVGTATDSAGRFSLWIPTGKYDLVVSSVGYETHAQTISHAPADTLVIKLSTKAELLDEVVVGGFEKEGWDIWGSFFLRQFIGTSAWAADCHIKNYEVIKFRNNKQKHRLSAFAGEQLVIENEALGYTIRYQLETFVYDFDQGYFLYTGYPLFVPMEGNRAKQTRWRKRRQEAYHGSMMEFMRALYRNRIAEEGYEVRRLVKTANKEKERIKEIYRNRVMQDGSINKKGISNDSADYYRTVLRQPDEMSTYSSYTLPGDSIAYQVDSLTAGLDFPDYLHIYYTKAPPPDSYRQISPGNKKMMSEIALVEGHSVEIKSNGNFYPPSNLLSLGYWAWSEKIANILPFDYKPPAVSAQP